MRIGFDAKRAYNNYSGLGNYSRYIINGLINHFPENIYYAYSPKVHEQLDVLVTDNIVLVQPSDFFSRKFKSIWRARGITNLLDKHEIDIYHGLSNELPIGIEEKFTKSVVTIHDLIFLRYPHLYAKLDRKIYNRKFRSACKRADAVIAISEQTKADIVEFYRIDPEKISVVYQDCSTSYQEPVKDEVRVEASRRYNLPEKYILSVGTIEGRKNQLHLVKAFCDLETDHKLVLVGRTTKYAEAIKEYLESRNKSSEVIFIDAVEQKYLPAIYSMAAIFVYPSIFEGFGIPIIEAQNTAVPVITSTGSCFQETGGNGALYVDPKDQKELSNQINDLLNNENMRLELIKLGKENCKRFRSEITIPQVYNIYKSLL